MAPSSLVGRVVDAESGQPLVGALLILRAESLEAIPGHRGSAIVGTSRSTTTNAEGSYRFDGLVPGRYLLRTEKLGYRSVSITVELRGAGASRAAIGLSVEPIELELIRITARPEGIYGRRVSSSAGGDASARLAAERVRRDRYLASDAQVLTHEAVIESVSLGEADLFRALRRMPGVTTRDDLSAELWTRGGRWDHTRVYFDELPVFNPLHAFGGLAGINVDAIGAAFLHPGARPISFGEGAAGIVDIRSRRGGGQGELRGVGEISLLSMRAALDQQVRDGNAAWMLSARRSYLDWITAEVPDSTIPYAFSDLTGRVDVHVTPDHVLELSGMWGGNAVEGDVLEVFSDVSKEWGSAVSRVTFDAPFRRGRIRHTLGRSRSAYSSAAAAASGGDTVLERSSITYHALTGEWGVGSEATAQWTTGYQLVQQTAHLSGYASPTAADSLPFNTTLRQVALWVERRWRTAERLTVAPGLRTEIGFPSAGSAAVWLSPRFTSRLQVTPDLSVSVGLGRSVQYAQAVAPEAVVRPARPRALYLWLLAGDGTPAVQSDFLTAGSEYWLAPGMLASLNGFVRRTRGVALFGHLPESLGQAGLFLTGETRAHGLELSARRFAGRWTMQAAYSFGVAEAEFEGWRFPASEDRRHTLDATSMLRLGSALRLGAAFTAMSGAPFTPFVHPESSAGAEAGAGTAQPPRIGAPNSRRAPTYASLDLLADWSGTIRGVRAGIFLQLHNALGHGNNVTYVRTVETEGPQGAIRHDRFTGGVPRLPNFGVRLSF